MKKTTIFMTLVLFILASFGSILMGQEQKMDEKKMMEMWAKYATPGEFHKYLEAKAGEWEIESKSWMKPGDEAMMSKAKATSKMILGGRYLMTKYSGTMMGKPFNGLNIQGYDNFQKKFHTLWIDDMGTGFFTTSGTLDKGTKILTETGVWDDIMTGGKSKVKTVETVINPGKAKFEMFMIMPDGKEFRSMELTYTRKK